MTPASFTLRPIFTHRGGDAMNDLFLLGCGYLS